MKNRRMTNKKLLLDGFMCSVMVGYYLGILTIFIMFAVVSGVFDWVGALFVCNLFVGLGAFYWIAQTRYKEIKK